MTEMYESWRFFHQKDANFTDFLFSFDNVLNIKFMGFRYIMKRVATNTNSKEIFDFDEQQQRKLNRIKGIIFGYLSFM